MNYEFFERSVFCMEPIILALIRFVCLVFILNKENLKENALI